MPVMRTRAVILQEGDDVLVRCEACGLTCSFPPELTAVRLDNFLQEHAPDVAPGLHPAECPQWRPSHQVG